MERIGPYEILEELGHGGMGVVYRAHQASLNRMIALKVLPSHLESDVSAVRRFRWEGETAARLKHDNIVAVYDAHIDEPPYYIAMEFLEGRSLESIIAQRGRLEPEQAVAIIAQVCAGLDHAHERGIIHRDIKPANIMLDESGKATITDFGIARAADRTRLTGTGSVLGSPHYMSPEQAKGLPVDQRTDLYSAGAVLYEMLTGRSPFAGGNALTVMNRITTEPPPAPRGFYPSIPPALDAVVLKALEKDPRARFQNGAELVRALQGALRESETSTYPHQPVAAGAHTTSAAGAAGVSGAPPSAVAPPRASRSAASRRSILLGAGLVAVLALVGAVLFYAVPRGRPPDVTGSTSAGPDEVTAETVSPGAGAGDRARVGPAIAADGRSAAPAGVGRGAGSGGAPPVGTASGTGVGTPTGTPPGPGQGAAGDQGTMVSIPDCRGMAKDDAVRLLTKMGLSCAEPRYEFSDGVDSGRVVTTSPRGSVPPGTVATLTVSKGRQPKCEDCGATFDTQAELDAHRSRELYACARYPDCPFTAESTEAVIEHYKSQSVASGLLSRTNCRTDAFIVGGKWRIKHIPAPACTPPPPNQLQIIKVPG